MSQDAVALRVAIDGVHAAMSQLRDLEQKLKDMGPAAKKGSNDAQRAMAMLRTSVQDVQRAYTSAAGRISSTWGGVTSALRSSAVAAASVAAGFAGILKIVQQFDKGQSFERTLQFNLGEKEGSNVARQAEKFAIRQGVDVNSTRQGVAQLAGTGMAGDQIMPTLEAFMALAATSGATSEGTALAFTQFAQIAATGKLQGDELRSIQENGVQLISILKAAGLGDRIGSQKDPISFQEIVDALRKFADDPKAKKAMEDQAKQASNAWQSALNEFQLVFLEPLGKDLAPAVKDVAGYLRELSKDLDPKKVAEFIKGLIDAGIQIAKWVVENKELLLGIAKAVVAFKALSLLGGVFKDLWSVGKGLVGAFKGMQAAIMAIKGLSTFMAGMAPGAVSGAASTVAGAAGAAGGGAAVAAIASTVGAVLAMSAVGVAAFGLTTMALDKLGYKEWLADKFGINDETTIAADPKTAAKMKQTQSASEFAQKAKDEYYGRPSTDAMGRKINYGITRAEQNATFSHMLARSLR